MKLKVLLSFQSLYSRAQASGQHHTVSIPVSHYIQHPGSLHNPCVPQRTGISAQVSLDIHLGMVEHKAESNSFWHSEGFITGVWWIVGTMSESYFSGEKSCENRRKTKGKLGRGVVGKVCKRCHHVLVWNLVSDKSSHPESWYWNRDLNRPDICRTSGSWSLLTFAVFVSGTRSCWMTTRPRFTCSAVPCVGWLCAWTLSALLWSQPPALWLSWCMARSLLPMLAWPSHTLCRWVWPHTVIVNFSFNVDIANVQTASSAGSEELQGSEHSCWSCCLASSASLWHWGEIKELRYLILKAVLLRNVSELLVSQGIHKLWWF